MCGWNTFVYVHVYPWIRGKREGRRKQRGKERSIALRTEKGAHSRLRTRSHVVANAAGVQGGRNEEGAIRGGGGGGAHLSQPTPRVCKTGPAAGHAGNPDFGLA